MKIYNVRTGEVMARAFTLRGAIRKCKKNLQFVDLRGLELWDVDLSGAHLIGANLCRSSFTGKSNLFCINLEYAKLNYFSAEDIDFTSLHAPHASMQHSHFGDSNFENAWLDDSNWYESDIEGACFTRTALTNSNLMEVKGKGADFRCADLSYSDLRDADFTDADFAGADLTGANLRGTCFDNARMTGITIS